MLQPSQLDEVSRSHAEDRQELRGFLSRSGLPLDGPGTIHAMALRLRTDHAFHRDLTSHLWVVMHGAGGRVSYGELLALLTLSAAGTRLATEAAADDAHELLRFVMEARGSFETPSAKDDLVRLPTRVPENGAAHSKGRTAAWLAVAACLLLAMLAGIRRVGRHSPSDPAASGLAKGSTSAVESRIPDVASSPAHETAASVPEPPPARPSAEVRNPEARQDRITVRNTPPPVAATAASPVTMAAARPAATAVPQPASTPVAAAGVSTPAPAITSARSAASPAVVPEAVLSQRLGARTLPYDAWLDGVTRDYPRLLRRKPGGTPVPVEDNHALLAENRTPVSMPAAGTVPVREGTVRPVSLGIMAGNLLYSPAPAYPPAASAAGVQGEVKVQAEIDRDGNVAFARVISGPPLLRDAAVDAVQHWRYRPWMAGGKPTGASAIAVVEFELD